MAAKVQTEFLWYVAWRSYSGVINTCGVAATTASKAISHYLKQNDIDMNTLQCIVACDSTGAIRARRGQKRFGGMLRDNIMSVWFRRSTGKPLGMCETGDCGEEYEQYRTGDLLRAALASEGAATPASTEKKDTTGTTWPKYTLEVLTKEKA